MKRISILLGCILLLLTACGGNKLDLDLEKVQNAVAERAVQSTSLEEDGYNSENVEIVRVCEAVKVGEEDQGFDGEYIVYWQTDDEELKNDFRMDKNYEADLSTQRLTEIEDRCISVN